MGQEAAAQQETPGAPALTARADGSGVGGIDLGFMAAKGGGAGLGVFACGQRRRMTFLYFLDGPPCFSPSVARNRANRATR